MRDYQSMSLDDLLLHHHEISETIQQRTNLKSHLTKPRKAYPPVRPKYRNPNNPSQTWCGRGSQPRWVHDLLAAGTTLEDIKLT
ncbi:H-NS family nucleoid-associated regulatory protein [Bradyrhizobium sp. WSM471]|uniref:H-NS family nucleoid-associated regulatory protein n=1 Tax=Bradyrhizobium sp. WSM471 TaxID=319017 RepID=UPI0009FB995B